MRLIDADALMLKFVGIPFPDILSVDAVRLAVDLTPTISPPTTTWLGNYSPYQCSHCGYHVDSKTKYCPECGRKAVR